MTKICYDFINFKQNKKTTTKMPEIIQIPSSEVSETHTEASEARRTITAPTLGGKALLADSIQSFYGATNAYLGRDINSGDIRSVIRKQDGSNEVIANTSNVGDTLQETLEAMHSIEKAVTSPIMFVKIDGKTTSFTELKHYNPRIAPTLEAYEVPQHLESILEDTGGGMKTYERTVAQEGWETALFEQVSTFLNSDGAGVKLMRDLDITSLNSLTPEQAVKLSLGIVQSVSKYSWIQEEGVYKPGGIQEDDMTTMELLAEGIDHHNETDWAGNGVCRNVASNVKALFESLKANQSDLSMLHNTYAVYSAAYGGETYGKRERDDNTKFLLKKDPSGHAWNTFVTVDKSGGSNITIVDATWAMGSNVDGSLKEPDYTMERMFESATALVAEADDKVDAAWAMSDYLNKFTRGMPGESNQVREQKQQFALTEWLKIAPILVEAGIQSVPTGAIGAAYRLGAKLDKSELQTLFTVHEAGWIDTFDAILGKYIDGKSAMSTVQRLIVTNDNLQRAIYEKLGSQAELYANQSTDFRIRLRELQTGVLPDFDPTNNVADKSELSSLMRDAGLFSMGDKYYGDVVRAGLLKAADGRQDVITNLTTGMSDYDILRHYREIRLAATKS